MTGVIAVNDDVTRTDTRSLVVRLVQLWPVQLPEGGVDASQLMNTLAEGIGPSVAIRFAAAMTCVLNASTVAGHTGPAVVLHEPSLEPIHDASTDAVRAA